MVLEPAPAVPDGDAQAAHNARVHTARLPVRIAGQDNLARLSNSYSELVKWPQTQLGPLRALTGRARAGLMPVRLGSG